MPMITACLKNAVVQEIGMTEAFNPQAIRICHSRMYLPSQTSGNRKL
jgi:hypothetical protein